MAMYIISGDETLISLELTSLVDRLVGTGDRLLMVNEFDCNDSLFSIGAACDAITTPSLFNEHSIAIVRNVGELKAEFVDTLVEAIDECIPEVDLVITSTGKMLKVIADASKRMKAETIGAVALKKDADRIQLVEAKLVEAGFTYAADAARVIAQWFGGDQSRIAGLVATLTATYGEGAKLTRSDIEPFLGDAGSIAPWDLTDAVDAGDTKKSLVMLRRMLSDSHPLQVLGLLANHYARMMKIDGRGVRTADDAVAILGGSPYPAKKMLNQYQRLGSGGISRAIELIATADMDMRGGKDWEPELVMEVLVARLAKLTTPTSTSSSAQYARGAGKR